MKPYKSFYNTRFECFCSLQCDLSKAINNKATDAEKESIEAWWIWIYKTDIKAATEQNLCKFVDAELPDLAARCADDISDEVYRAYMLNETR